MILTDSALSGGKEYFAEPSYVRVTVLYHAVSCLEKSDIDIHLVDNNTTSYAYRKRSAGRD